MIDLIIYGAIAVVSFVAGILFGRANKKKTEALYQAAKKAEEETRAQLDKVKKK